MWCRRAMIPERSSQALPNSKELSVLMTSGFLSGSRNFCKLLWIHWVARSCTTTACRWLFRDSQLSLRTLWSAVIMSTNFSARGTASPLRLLHGALVILVCLQISQFRSLGKWVWTLFTQILTSLCSPALKKLHEKNWRESLPVMEFHHPPNFPWILAAIPGSQNHHTGFSVLSWFPS